MRSNARSLPFRTVVVAFGCLLILVLAGGLCTACAAQDASEQEATVDTSELTASDVMREDDSATYVEPQTTEEAADTAAEAAPSAEELYGRLSISEDMRSSFVHGEKGAQYQKYIVLHDTEGDSDAQSVVNWWDSNGKLVAAHFVVNKDGSIVQCVSLDKIAHHAGYGDTGHNDQFGISEDGRDDMAGSSPIGSWASDYGMNAWSVGIELVHVGGSGDYPEAQLEALDNLIAYIDAYYGFESQIIDHKDWRTGNSDTSAEFATYLGNYKQHRTHLA